MRSCQLRHDAGPECQEAEFIPNLVATFCGQKSDPKNQNFNLKSLIKWKKMAAGSLASDKIQCEKSMALKLVFLDWWKNWAGRLLSVLGSFHDSGSGWLRFQYSVCTSNREKLADSLEDRPPFSGTRLPNALELRSRQIAQKAKKSGSL